MSENSKIWILLFLVGVLISFGYITHYLGAVDDANLALHESKSKLQGMQEMISMRRQRWQEQEQIRSKIQAETGKTAALLKSQENLDPRYRTAESALNYSVESMKTAVEKVRGSAVGADLGEVILTSGRVLRAVKVRKVDDSGIAMIHADGIGTIPPEQLPESLREKYDLGANALLPLLLEAQAALGTTGAPKTKASPPVKQSSALAETTQPAANNSNEDKIKSLRSRMAALDSQVTDYAHLMEQYKNAASNHQGLAAIAKGRGQPTSRHTDNANDSLAQAAAVERQISALRAEQKKLSIELDHAVNSR